MVVPDSGPGALTKTDQLPALLGQRGLMLSRGLTSEDKREQSASGLWPGERPSNHHRVARWPCPCRLRWRIPAIQVDESMRATMDMPPEHIS